MENACRSRMMELKRLMGSVWLWLIICMLCLNTRFRRGFRGSGTVRAKVTKVRLTLKDYIAGMRIWKMTSWLGVGLRRERGGRTCMVDSRRFREDRWWYCEWPRSDWMPPVAQGSRSSVLGANLFGIGTVIPGWVCILQHMPEARLVSLQSSRMRWTSKTRGSIIYIVRNNIAAWLSRLPYFIPPF